MLTTFVLFRREIITTRILISLSGILALFGLISYSGDQIYYELYSLQMLLQIFIQVLIGVMSALILNIVFEVFIAIGQITSTQIGLSTASIIDPRFGYITSLSHFYMIVASLIFLLLNGHLFAIRTIMDSFNMLPIYQNFLPTHLFATIMKYAALIFSGSVMVSVTIIIVLLLMNIALAVMTKFAPQFNLFTVGINLQLILGLIVIYLTFRLFVDHSGGMLTEGLAYLHATLVKAN
jgi:flagellar biosynthetic protein FliR